MCSACCVPQQQKPLARRAASDSYLRSHQEQQQRQQQQQPRGPRHDTTCNEQHVYLPAPAPRSAGSRRAQSAPCPRSAPVAGILTKHVLQKRNDAFMDAIRATQPGVLSRQRRRQPRQRGAPSPHVLSYYMHGNDASHTKQGSPA